MLTFDDESHTYRWKGKVVPSVTQVLQPIHDLSMVPSDVLAAASAFGTAVHRACELYDRRTLDEARLDQSLVPYLRGWKEFLSDHGTEWTAIEQPLFNQRFGYAGTPDRIGFIDDCPAVLDIKSSAELYPAVGPQLAAYAMAQNPQTGSLMRRYGLRLFPNGYEMRAYTDATDWTVFCSLLTIRTWTRRHNITPTFKESHV
jgi:hypothetical protein